MSTFKNFIDHAVEMAKGDYATGSLFKTAMALREKAANAAAAAAEAGKAYNAGLPAGAGGTTQAALIIGGLAAGTAIGVGTAYLAKAALRKANSPEAARSSGT
jgi:hypothetical protein